MYDKNQAQKNQDVILFYNLQLHLSKGWQNIFCEEPDGKCFKLDRPYSSLCCNYSTVPLWQESGHRQYISEWVSFSVLKKLYSQKQAANWLSPEGHSLLTPEISQSLCIFGHNFSFLTFSKGQFQSYAKVEELV